MIGPISTLCLYKLFGQSLLHGYTRARDFRWTYKKGDHFRAYAAWLGADQTVRGKTRSQAKENFMDSIAHDNELLYEDIKDERIM